MAHRSAGAWRITRWVGLSAATFLGAAPLEALTSSTERIPDAASIQQRLGKVIVHGSGSLSNDAQRLSGGVQVRQLFNSPWFLATDARLEQELRASYDLRHWGGDVGVGRALNATTDLLATYRLDHYRVFHTGGSGDPAFLAVTGPSFVTALGVALLHDSRDDPFYPTRGVRARLSGELALKAFGGDYNFSRLDADLAYYVSPLHELASGTLLEEVTFVEHLRVGWVAAMDGTHAVPFFERYYVGGANTVRGHRSRWVTSQGVENEFLGGDAQLINNLEARLPVFPRLLDRRLSAVAFFDVGRAARRFSKIGDFGYGVGVGLRYVVKCWKLHGVARADYGIDLAREAGGDSSSRVHLTFGIPF